MEPLGEGVVLLKQPNHRPNDQLNQQPLQRQRKKPHLLGPVNLHRFQMRMRRPVSID